MLEFKVENQTISRTDAFSPVADSRNYLTAKFEMSDEWTGDVTAVFGYGGEFYHQILDGNSCTVPWEVIRAPYFTVSLFCGDLITSNEVRIAVQKSGMADGEVPGTPTPTIWQGYVEKLSEKNAAELDAAIKKIYPKAETEIPSILAPNTEYYLGETANLKIVFPNGNIGEYCFVKFKSGAAATQITVEGDNFVGDIPTPIANKTYEIIANWNGEKWVCAYRGY